MWFSTQEYWSGLPCPFLVAQMVKRLPAMGEIWIRSLGQENPLEKEMATHSSTLAWKIPWMEESCRLQSMGSQRIGPDWATSLSLYSIYSCYKYWLYSLCCTILKGGCWTTEDAGIFGLQRRIQSRARDEAWLLRVLCNKVLLKYKRDRQSFWHKHQKGGQKECPPPSL